MAFPIDPLDFTAEMYIDGAWTDQTEYVRGNGQNAVRINQGYASEQSSLQSCTCSFQLSNPEGRFSNRNPMSPYYDQLPKNTPFRMRVGTAESFLVVNQTRASNSYASAPDSASLDITGDIDVAIEITPDSWTDTVSRFLMGKYTTETDERSWAWVLEADGKLRLYWSPDGTIANRVSRVSTAALPTSNTRLSVRAFLDVNNGASGHDVKFYYSTTGVTGPWTQLGSTVTTAGTTSIFNSTSSLDVGGLLALVADVNFIGKVHKAIVKNSVGTTVASPDFTTADASDRSVTDAQGNVFALTSGARISNPAIRFTGEISKFPYQADSTNTNVYSNVTASGITRRLSQGRDNLRSPIYRMLSQYNPTGYFPMEDGSGSTSLANAASNGEAGTFSGVSFGSDETLPGTDGVLTLDEQTSYVHGSALVTATTSAASASWFYRMDAIPPDETVLISFRSTGTVKRWDIIANFNAYAVRGYDGSGTKIAEDTFSNVGILPTDWISMHLEMTTVSGSINWVLNMTKVGSGLFGSSGNNSLSGSVGRFTGFDIVASTNLVDTKFAHILLTQDDLPFVTGSYSNASIGYVGETALDRMIRLSAEEGVPFFYNGDPSDTEAMGAQKVATYLELLEECSEVDRGLLYEPADTLGIYYTPRVSLLNQNKSLELNASQGHLSDPFLPVDDDQRTRNDVTVSRPSGSSARVEATDGPNTPALIGRYQENVSLNAAYDTQLPYLAGWRVFQGTWDEARYEQVPIQLSRSAFAGDSALTADVIDTGVGSRIGITDLPVFQSADDVDLLVLGYEEVLGQFQWDITWNAIPYGPYIAGLIDGSDTRLDAEDSKLASGVNSTATSLSVTASADPLWVRTATAPSEFPFNIKVGGELMTVTAISGSSFPQTFTVTRSVNGVVKSHSANALVRLASPTYLTL